MDPDERKAGIARRLGLPSEDWSDKALSTTAQNCKVIVNAGTVTLSGVVNSTDERDRIGSLASSSGAANVVNQLEIAKGN